MMVKTTLTENPKKKPSIFTGIQSTRHQSLKKFYNQLKRLSTLSSSKNIFQELAIYHEKYLKNSEYKTKLQYQQTKKNNWNKKKGKRDVIWFNPLYSKPIKINFGRTLIKLISKHFPPNLKFVKMFMPYIR